MVQKSASEQQSAYKDQLAAVPDFADYGPVLGSSKQPAQLTESETEYVVSCVKHIYREHIVFQVWRKLVRAYRDTDSRDSVLDSSSMFQTL